MTATLIALVGFSASISSSPLKPNRKQLKRRFDDGSLLRISSVRQKIRSGFLVNLRTKRRKLFIGKLAYFAIEGLSF